jgi:hypothetical protein
MEVTKHDMENEKNAQIAAPMSTDEPAADEAVFTDIPRPVVPPGATYQTIDTFAWDQVHSMGGNALYTLLEHNFLDFFQTECNAARTGKLQLSYCYRVRVAGRSRDR